jgi:hypothetical protein
MPCSLVGRLHRVVGTYCLRLKCKCGLLYINVSEVYLISYTLKMEAAASSEALVRFYQSTRYHIPEDSNLHIRRSENVKSHKYEYSDMCWGWDY